MWRTIIMVVNIITLNVRGLADDNKRRAIFEFYRKRCDILCLQETHSTQKNEVQWKAEWGGPAYFSHGESNARGVVILVKKGAAIDISQETSSSDGRWIMCNVFADGTSFALINIYAPNTDNPLFFVNLFEKSLQMACKKVYVGDFNTILNPDIDTNSELKVKSKAAIQIESLMEVHSICDVWRIRNQNAVRYSWFRSIKNNPRSNKGAKSRCFQASRLDLCLVSQGLCQSVHNIFYLNGIKTDHSALLCSIDANPQERGPSYWKFNTSMLLDKDFVTSLNDYINLKLVQFGELSPNNKWERIKESIKEYCITKSKERIKRRGKEISDLAEEITELENSISNLQENQITDLCQKKARLDELQSERAKSVMFRSKCKWVELGEKNSRYFYALESSNYNSKTITCLMDEEGQEVKNPAEILNMQKEFYSDLYNNDASVRFNLKGKAPNQVMEEDKILLNEEFTLDELSRAVKELKNRKCPGPDGLPTDLYKVFWRTLKQPLKEAIDFAWRIEELHTTALRGVLNLIPKGDKDTRYLKNVRPITLLNTDYKIIEKMLANRIVPQLEQIIHTDQKGFIPNRKISHNIRKIIDVINQIEDEPGLIVQIDFQKAFDKCEHDAVLGSLDFFNFPDYIIKWVKILYQNFKVRVQNNGFMSEAIPIKRSVHQGGPNSAALFICIAEILALDIRADQDIKGVFINEIENLLNQFADDTDLCLTAEDGTPLRKTFQVLKNFRNNTGCVVNYDKTTVYRIGSLKKSKAKFYTQEELNWQTGSINVLGIDVGNDMNSAAESNYRRIIDKCKAILRIWSKRSLSLIGKIEITNTLIASRFVYAMCVLPTMSEKLFAEMEMEISNFLWNNHKPKISMDTLQCNKGSGGLGLVNLRLKDKALKAGWIVSLFENDELRKSCNSALKNPADFLLWKCNLDRSDAEKCFNKKDIFWNQVLGAWCDYHYENTLDMDQVVWYNSCVRIQQTPVFWGNPAQKGLIWIKQLFEEGSKDFKTNDVLADEFGLSFMQSNSLKSAIAASIKAGRTLLKSCITDKLAEAIMGSKVVKRIYSELNRRSPDFYKLAKQWSVELDADIEQSEIQERCEDMWFDTNIPAVRAF